MAVPLPHKSFRVFSLLCLLACHFLPTLCQTSTNNSDTGPGPQAVTFTVPDSGSDDFTQRFVDGQTVPASWTGDTTWTGSLGDLWLTWFYSNAYTLLLLENVDMRISSDYSWLIDLNSTLIATDPRFVLRFKPHVVDPPDYNATGGTWGMYSRGFVVALGSSSETLSTSSTQTLSTSSSSPTSRTQISASTTTSAAPIATTSSAGGQGTSNGLSVGAKAGIGVAAVLGAILLVGITVILTRRYLARSRDKEMYNTVERSSPQEIRSVYPGELHSDSTQKVTIQHGRPVELPGE